MSPCRCGRPLGRRRSDLCHVVGWYPTSVRQTGRLITAHRARRYMPQPAKSRPDMLIGRKFVSSGPRDMAWGISVSVLCPRPSGRSMGRPKGSRLACCCGDEGMVRAKFVELGSKVAGLVGARPRTPKSRQKIQRCKRPKTPILRQPLSEIGSEKLGVCRLWLGPSGRPKSGPSPYKSSVERKVDKGATEQGRTRGGRNVSRASTQKQRQDQEPQTGRTAAKKVRIAALL